MKEIQLFLSVVFTTASAALLDGSDVVHSGDCVCAGLNIVGLNKAGFSNSEFVTMMKEECVTVTGVNVTADGNRWFEMKNNEKTLWIADRLLPYFVPCSSDVSTGTCSALQKQLACAILNNRNIILATAHQSGKTDNAFALNNIRDMCNGGQASRSSYSCKECESGAPGGSVCISSSVLNYVITLGNGGRVRVNELAGACHTCKSKHYLGLAVDLDHGPRFNEYIKTCRNMGGVALDESNHIHCQFNS